MGTDIHFLVEARWDSFGGDKTKWHAVVPPPGRVDVWGCPLYQRRNYPLFSFLSDVGDGATIVKTAPQRGLPASIDAVSTRLEFYSVANSGMAKMVHSDDGYYAGDYGHTWATVGELLDLPWDHAKVNYATVTSLPMRDYCADFLAWLGELNHLYGRDHCRVIWGFDS